MPKTCPGCNGSRRLKQDVRRSWWEVVLLRPAVVDELCGQCGGIGVVKGSPEQEEAFERQRQRKLQERERTAAEEKARKVAAASPPRSHVANRTTTICMITCQIPADILQRISSGQTRAVLAKCAAFAGNPVVDQYDIASGHREIMCVDNPPSVVYKFTVPVDQGQAVSEAMRRSWRELMVDIRRAGLQALMRA